MRIFLVLLTVCFAALTPQGAFSRTETIAAVVNDDVVSLSDLNDRMKLIVVSSGLPQTQEVFEKLKGQVMVSLVEEQIMMQEAGRLDIKVSQEEIDQGFKTIAQQNNFTPEQFQDVLKNSGINADTIRRQIESQIAWGKIIQAQVRPRIVISDNDIDNVDQRLKNSIGRAEFLVAEIFLPVEEVSQEGDTRQLSQKLKQEIDADKNSFMKLAQQFSKSAGAAQGGDIGWVQEDQLPEDLVKVLRTMKPEDISAPVRSLTGYHILLLRDMRRISEDTMPSREQIMNSLGTQRLDRMQRRYLLDLKSAAFIEVRV